MKYPYFRGLEADRYSFYRVPKALIKVDLFEKMSGDAKLLYAVLLDRMNLSLKNGWQDENGNAYIICTIDEIMDSIRCARQKAVKLLDELEHEYQLIERRRQGLGKPNLLYVKDLYAGLSQSNYWKYENQTSGGLKSELPGVWKSNGSKTDINNTDSSETDLIYSAQSGENISGEMREDERYEHGGRLPYHVRLLLDEFANIGQIPKFDKLIATIRSREISASIILQSQSQLKTIYKDAAETIIGNCDTMLFLGGKESSTLKEISETLGKETIDLYNTSDTRGNSPSFGTNYQKTGKELMSRDELAVMDGSKCILQLRGVRPFLSDKFDITKHKRYKELSDFDKKNEFDVERYLKHELRLLTTEEFDLYEVDVTEQAQG